MKLLFNAIAALLFVIGAQSASAQGFNSNNVFFGGGLSINDADSGDDGTGFQIFGGYEFGEIAANVRLDAEVGYMDSGDLGGGDEATGLWAAGVGRLTMSPQLELLGRLGMDFGDDDGALFGVGAGWHLNKQSTVRFELVERDEISSMQVNFVYRP